MTESVKVPAAQADNLRVIPTTYTVEEKYLLLQVVLWCPHARCGMWELEPSSPLSDTRVCVHAHHPPPDKLKKIENSIIL